LTASVTLGVGQFCTNPGLVVGLDSKDIDDFIHRTGLLLEETPVETMLSTKILDVYRKVWIG